MMSIPYLLLIGYLCQQKEYREQFANNKFSSRSFHSLYLLSILIYNKQEIKTTRLCMPIHQAAFVFQSNHYNK
jgi:hypothetical protein